MTTRKRVAIVTGGNRGMGLESCRQLAERNLRVVLTSRDVRQGEAAARELHENGLDVQAHALDITDATSIASLVHDVDRELGGADVLINNAGVYLDAGTSVLDVSIDTIRATFETNSFGPLRLCQAVVPGMLERGYGRIVNLSSGLGQLSSMRDYAPSYSMSKAALNALTRMVADAVREGGKDILVNAVDPGWVKTEMGGRGAPRSVAKGVETTIWLATLPKGGPTGGFFHDRKPVPW
jgi:NAD(P)-dependent dehydrogenase (short-subunit alcohol dehydrogenase family)